MKFHISITRGRYNEEGDLISPCEEAYEDTYIRIDSRVISDVKDLWGDEKQTWYLEGFNHRSIPCDNEGCDERCNGSHLARDFNDQDWFINIDTLEQLIEFMKKYKGRLVLQSNYWYSSLPYIEIYNNYRE